MSASLWRATLADAVLPTLLVDQPDDQATLDALLGEGAAGPSDIATLHSTVRTLIERPFTIRPRSASRFVAVGDPGIWYGAHEKRTAYAEVGYWYLRFVLESPALQEVGGIAETARLIYSAEVAGKAVDLSAKPWSARNVQWTDPSDYSSCQALARAAPVHGIDWIQYISARDPEAGLCAAALRRAAVQPGPLPEVQTWFCRLPETGRTRRVEWLPLQELFANTRTESYAFQF